MQTSRNASDNCWETEPTQGRLSESMQAGRGLDHGWDRRVLKCFALYPALRVCTRMWEEVVLYPVEGGAWCVVALCDVKRYVGISV